MIKKLPLKPEEKRQVLVYVVNTALDYVLQDAQLALAEPAVKLQALEEKRREIQKYMNLWEISWYHIRYNPIQTVVVSAASVIVACTAWRQFQGTVVHKALVGWALSVYSIVCGIGANILALLEKIGSLLGLKTAKSARRYRPRRILRR